MIDIEEIRKQVAVKHNTVLGENDPLLMLVTMNDLVLEKCIERLNSQNEAHQRGFSAALDEAVEKSIAESRKVSGRIITDGANYVTDRCKESIAEAMALAVVAARVEIKNELVNSTKAIEVAKRSGLLNGWLAASLTTLALVVLLKVFV